MGKPEDNTEEAGPSGIWQDPRFAHLVSDPRFKQLPKSQRKVKIDKRFQSMFDDDKFKIKYTVDKYGRKVNKSSSEDLKKYYEIEESDEEDEEEERRKEEIEITKESGEEDEEGAEEDNDDLGSDGEILPEVLKKKLLDTKVDYARGEGRLLTDSSSDEESSEDEDDELFIEHVWGELDNDAETTEESTRRLAALNMDWDRIRASDIMVLCNSFLPPGGSILSVTIYPSEFGKERMAEEEIHGPPELTKSSKDKADTAEGDDSDEELVKEVDSDAEEGDDYHMEKLRQYQLNRLRYYYAVIECDSVETADKIYKECDGIEYESTATKLDFRFIPDDTSFDDDEPKDVCTELPDLQKYKPRLFTTTALQQAKVDLTWDETSVERKELGDKLSAGKMDDVSETDLRKFVAYSSEEEGDDEEEGVVEKEDEKHEQEQGEQKRSKKDDPISKYKSLLEEINKKEEEKKKSKFEMEYTWGIDTDGKSKEKDKPVNKDLTPIEKVLEKRREKNKKRKEERKKKKRGLDGSDEETNEVSDDDLPDGIDMNDPYFAEEFANGEFEDPKPKSKSKDKKGKKSSNENGSDGSEDEEEKQAKELELLMDDGDDDKNHFSLQKILSAENETKSKKKRKKQLKKSKGEIDSAKQPVEDNFDVNVEDDRFKAVYTSHLFNIDPTDPNFKKTKGMEKIIHEKLKRRHGSEAPARANQEDEVEAKRPKKRVEDSILVKNLKRKIQKKNVS